MQNTERVDHPKEEIEPRTPNIGIYLTVFSHVRRTVTALLPERGEKGGGEWSGITKQNAQSMWYVLL